MQNIVVVVLIENILFVCMTIKGNNFNRNFKPSTHFRTLMNIYCTFFKKMNFEQTHGSLLIMESVIVFRCCTFLLIRSTFEVMCMNFKGNV